MLEAPLSDKSQLMSSSIASDLPKGTALLADLTINLNSVISSVKSLTERIKAGELKTGKGISLLELKNQTFLSYINNLTYTVLRKLSGQKLHEEPCIERLVESRVVIERLRPIEEKLKYQIDKYVKVAVKGKADENDPTQLKGDLDNIGSSDDDTDEEEPGSSGVQGKKKVNRDADTKLYKIPKISQVHYPDEADTSTDAKDKARRRALNSTMLRDALYEHTDDPEVVFNADVLKQKAMKKRRELERYEEDNMIRVTMSKRDRASMQEITTLGTIGSEMLAFNSLDALDEGFEPNSKKKKSKLGKMKSTASKKKKGGKGGFKKRGGRKH